jgi:hypothetical protein
LTQKQALDRTAARHAVSEEPRGKHLRVVQDEQVSRPEMVAKAGKRREIVGGVGGGSIAMQDEEPRCTANSRWILRNQLIRKLEVEVVNIHG